MVDCRNCGRKFAIKLTCPKCLQSFCSACMGDPNFEVKLQPLRNQYDPEGDWKRVCRLCYLTRPANNYKNEGASRDWLEKLFALRDQFKRGREEETRILENRLELLMKYDPGAGPLLNYEKEIIEWQSDNITQSCKECKKEFSNFLQRKHHCRLCGQIMCTGCSRFLPVRVSKQLVNNTRICIKCDNLIMKRKSLQLQSDRFLDDNFSKYLFLKQQIAGLMPRYRDLLERCREGISNEKINLQDTFIEAEAARNTIMLQFVHYEATIKSIFNSISSNPTEKVHVYPKMLKENIIKAAQLFLKKNLLSLQLLPIYEELEKQKNDYKAKLIHQQQLEELAHISSTTKATTSPSLIHSIYSLMERRLTISQEPTGGENEGILLANLQALLDKYKILKEQETHLESMLSKSAGEDTIVLKEALQDCQKELQVITKTLNNIQKQ